VSVSAPSAAVAAEAIRAGRVIWITGLSGAGKTTVATELVRRLRSEGARPILLDGDELRAALGVVGGFDLEQRRRLAFVYARLCRLLADQGHTVVCATIALYHEVRAWNRTNLAGYTEVFLDVPLDELERRDPKGIYAASGNGHAVVGVDLVPELPTTPDLVVPNFGSTTPGAAVDRILELDATKGAP